VVKVGAVPGHFKGCRAAGTSAHGGAAIGVMGELDVGMSFNAREDLGLDEPSVAAGHGVVLKAALAALRVLPAVGDGDADHDREAVLGNKRVEGGEEHPVGAVGADDERRRRAGLVSGGYVDGDLARPRRGVAVGDDHLRRIVGIGLAGDVRNEGDAGVDLAFSRGHRKDSDAAVSEVRDLALGMGLSGEGGELGRRRVRGADDEVAVGGGRRDLGVRELPGLDVARGVGIARGRGGTPGLRVQRAGDKQQSSEEQNCGTGFQGEPPGTEIGMAEL